MGENAGNYGGNMGGGQEIDPNMDPDLAMVKIKNKYHFSQSNELNYNYNEI